MSKRTGMWIAAAVAVVGMVFVGQGISQPAGGDNAGGRGGRAGRGGFDPEQMRKRIADRMKQELGASEDEWKVIEPKLEKVIAAQTESRLGGLMGMMGRGGRGGDRGGANAASRPAPANETAKASAELKKVLDNKEAKAEEIKTALQGLRDARAKAKAALEAAQKDLREVLTTRQEAQLVMMGTLE